MLSAAAVLAVSACAGSSPVDVTSAVAPTGGPTDGATGQSDSYDAPWTAVPAPSIDPTVTVTLPDGSRRWGYDGTQTVDESGWTTGPCWTSSPAVADGYPGDGTVGDGTVGDGTVGDSTVGDSTVGDSTVGDSTVGDSTPPPRPPCTPPPDLVVGGTYACSAWDRPTEGTGFLSGATGW